MGTHEQEDAPIKLLEVASQRSGVDRGIEVFVFDPGHDVPFPSAVAEITELELSLIARGALSLPEGWGLDDIRIFTREELATAEGKLDA